MNIKYKSIFKSLLLGSCFAIVTSCQITDLDINKDPNRPSTGSLALLLPNSINAAYNAANFSDPGWSGIRNGNDDYSLTNATYSGTWDFFYNSTQNLEEMLKSSADGKNPRYRGIALTLKAYAMGNFVDSFGDAPFTEAWKGNAETAIFNAKFDKDSDIYEQLIKMCDEAVD